MGNKTDPPDPAGASAAERATALAILLQRQNLLQIQQNLPVLRAQWGARAYAAWVAAEFPGLPDPLTLGREEFLRLLCRETPALADLLTDAAELAELERRAYGLLMARPTPLYVSKMGRPGAIRPRVAQNIGIIRNATRQGRAH